MKGYKSESIMSRQIHIWNFNSICRKMTKKSPENEILAKAITHVEEVKRDKSQTWSVLCQDKSIYGISTQYVERWQRKVRKTKFLQRAITQLKVGQTRQN